jgi:hypothetical protein
MKTSNATKAIYLPTGLIASLVIATASAQIVADGTFESPVVPTGQYLYSPTNALWTFGGSSGILSPPGQGPAGNFAAPAAPSGAQMAFLQRTSSPLPSFLEQSITLPAPGVYELSYLVAGRPGIGPQQGNCQYDVFLGLQPIASGESSFSGQSFTPKSFRFAATAGTYVLRFQTRNRGFDDTAFFDSVSLTTISTNTQPAQLTIGTYAGVTIDGVLGGRYVIEYAERVPGTNWIEVTNVVLTTTPFTYYDRLLPTSLQRYYRAFQIQE